jgi:hypothetical protein
MTTGLKILIVAAACATTGCQWANRLGASRDQFGPKAACALPPEASKDELVAYLNKNVLAADGQPGLRGWKTEQAKIRMHGFKVDATLQVAAPRNFRLRVLQPMSNSPMLDIGSNNHQFWIWSKQTEERVVLTCRHDEIAPTAAKLDLPLPVQPEWMMEVLGVIPLDPNQFRMERDSPGSPLVNLIAECNGPSGEPVQRRIQVNSCHGIVTLHELRNAEGKTIAKASFSGHYRDPETKLILVKQIRLDLPQEKMILALELDRIQVNPVTTEDSVVWNVPQLPGHRMVDLAEVARNQGPGAKQYAELPGEFTRGGTSPASTTASGEGQGLEAPAWPLLEAGGPQPPKLSFEEEAAAGGEAEAFTPLGDGFQMPESNRESEVQPAGRAFRGQSPPSAAASPTGSEKGFFSRLKAFFTRKSWPADGPPAGYSPATSRSSWGPPRLGQE